MSNYIATGADAGTDTNGLYVETGVVNGKPQYIYTTASDKYAYWDGTIWRVGLAADGTNAGTYWSNPSTGSTCPLTGWVAHASLGTGLTPPTFAPAASGNNSSGFFEMW